MSEERRRHNRVNPDQRVWTLWIDDDGAVEAFGEGESVSAAGGELVEVIALSAVSELRHAGWRLAVLLLQLGDEEARDEASGFLTRFPQGAGCHGSDLIGATAQHLGGENDGGTE